MPGSVTDLIYNLLTCYFLPKKSRLKHETILGCSFQLRPDR